MGKKQHQKDKLYLTCTEWSSIYGGKKANADLQKEILKKFKRLPFGYCCLSLQSFEHPYSNEDGYVFELSNIVEFVKKFGFDPISGKKTDLKKYFKLNFSKNKEGEYQCPVIFKTFNSNSHIVAIRKTGNVYSFEAVNELNFKAKNYNDLLTNESFTRDDVITLQEQNNIEKHNYSNFYYVKNNFKLEEEEKDEDKKSKSNIKNINQTMKSTLEELEKINKVESSNNVSKEQQEKKKSLDQFNSGNYSTGKMSASLTCTCLDSTRELEIANIGDDKYRYSQVKKKGYVQLETNFGPLNFELHCDKVPKTCDNFIKLCEKGYYDECIFYRLIKYFILQGGDPTGTGKGGQSIWGHSFEDEFDNNFSHDRRGILSMANSGKNTNKSNFFITFKSCKHLDKKHTIFGHLVGGMEALNKIENIPTNDKDKPLQEVKILKTNVFVNPFKLVEQYIESERQKAKDLNLVKDIQEDKEITNYSKLNTKVVGSLIDLKKLYSNDFKAENDNREMLVKKVKKETINKFGNFENW